MEEIIAGIAVAVLFFGGVLFGDLTVSQKYKDKIKERQVIIIDTNSYRCKKLKLLEE